MKSKNKKNDGSSQRKETAEDTVNAYFEEDLEEKKTLLWWANFEASSSDNKIKLALCKVTRKYLTPCLTSTSCERLFSVAGQIMDEKRTNLLPENLEKILFVRENIIATIFSLDW